MNNILSKSTIDNLERMLISKKYSQLEKIIEGYEKFNFNLPAVQMIYAASKCLKPSATIKDKKISFDIYLNYFKKNNSFTKALYNACALAFEIDEYSSLLSVLQNYIYKKSYDSRLFEALYKIYHHIGELDKSIHCLEIIVKNEPKNYNAWSSLIFFQNYVSKVNQKKYINYCKEFSKNLENYSHFSNKLKINKKIRLAFITLAFDGNSIDGFLIGLLKNIHKNEFEIISFNLNKTDNKSDHLKKYFDEWYHVYNLSDSDLISFIRNKEDCIIIDLYGYGPDNKMIIFKNRVAHLQILWLGYCNSTGLEEVDYIIADKNLIKEDELADYSEKPIFIKDIWNSYDGSYLKEIKVNNSPFLKNNFITFGSFNNFTKVNSEVIKVWSEILINTNSKLILKSSSKVSIEKFAELKKKFPKKLISKNKLIIYPGIEKKEDHLKLYNKIDVGLDTFPYTGVTTTFESLWMGVPVITMKGSNYLSRCGESINKNFHLENFLAKDKYDYISKAIKICNDLDYLKKLRGKLRKMLKNSSLLDTENFTKDFCAELKKAWSKHQKSKLKKIDS